MEIGSIVKIKDEEWVAIGYDKLAIQEFIETLQYLYSLCQSINLTYNRDEIMALHKILNLSKREQLKQFVVHSLIFVPYPFHENPLVMPGYIEKKDYILTDKKLKINMMTLYLKASQGNKFNAFKARLEALDSRIVDDITGAKEQIKEICDLVTATKEEIYKAQEERFIAFCLTKTTDYANICYKDGIWYRGAIMNNSFYSFAQDKNIFSVLTKEARNTIIIPIDVNNLYSYKER